MAATTTQVRCLENETPIIRYHSGLIHYEEGLTDGRWLVRNWSSIGIVDYDPIVIGPAHLNAAFGLEMDGESLHHGWIWGGMDELTASPGHQHVVVTLKHQIRPATIRVHTLLDGTPILNRWLEIKNTGKQPATLGSLWVWSGRVFPIQSGDREWTNAPYFTTTHSPYSLGYFVKNQGFMEGDFQWRPLGPETIQIGQDVGRSGWSHPIAYLRDEASGQIFVAQLAWSGNWAIRVIPREADRPGQPQLFLQAGPISTGPMRVIEPGENIETPPVHFGCMNGDLTDMVQALHEHQRRSVTLTPPAGKELLVSFNHSGCDLQENTTEINLRKQINVAAEIGADMFTIDACWNGETGQHWSLTTGDWRPAGRLPNGLEPIFAYARSKGLKCGLWCWIEAAHLQSKLIKEHPDWLLQRDGHRMNNMLDFSKPEVAQWVENDLARLIEQYKLDLYRIDYNESPGEGGYNLRHGFTENTLWRHYEAWYGILERIHQRFPNLIIENCAGGGGRTDLGMMSRTHYTWISDYNVMPRSARTLCTMMYALAPELTVRYMGTGMDAHVGGSLEMQLRIAVLSGNPCFIGLWVDKEEIRPDLRDRVRHAIEIFKRYVRPIIATCRMVHHTPINPGDQPEGWNVLEYASPDQTRAVAGLFRLAGPAAPDHTIRFRGLSRSKTYRIRHDNTGEVSIRSGVEIIERGVVVSLPSPMSSELLIVEETA
jgi:alpha-galactosidase